MLQRLLLLLLRGNATPAVSQAAHDAAPAEEKVPAGQASQDKLEARSAWYVGRSVGEVVGPLVVGEEVGQAVVGDVVGNTVGNREGAALVGNCVGLRAPPPHAQQASLAARPPSPTYWSPYWSHPVLQKDASFS